MPFILTPNVSVERGSAGFVTGLQHLTEPFLDAPAAGAKSLATAYVREVASIYGIPNSWIQSLSDSPSTRLETAGTELRYSRHDALSGTTTVSFQQTHFGLPVWEAGLVVVLLSNDLKEETSVSLC